MSITSVQTNEKLQDRNDEKLEHSRKNLGHERRDKKPEHSNLESDHQQDRTDEKPEKSSFSLRFTYDSDYLQDSNEVDSSVIRWWASTETRATRNI